MNEVTESRWHDPAAGDDFLGSITVEPGKTSSLMIGIYEKGFPEPETVVETSPSNASIESTLVRDETRGDVLMRYVFENRADEPCLVTVRQCAA